MRATERARDLARTIPDIIAFSATISLTATGQSRMQRPPLDRRVLMSLRHGRTPPRCPIRCAVCTRSPTGALSVETPAITRGCADADVPNDIGAALNPALSPEAPATTRG